jgi:hypothetical protein
MSEILEGIKKLAEKAAKSAQKAMSDQPPAPVESGGVAEKLPKPGVVVSPPPTPAAPVPDVPEK